MGEDNRSIQSAITRYNEHIEECGLESIRFRTIHVLKKKIDRSEWLLEDAIERIDEIIGTKKELYKKSEIESLRCCHDLLFDIIHDELTIITLCSIVESKTEDKKIFRIGLGLCSPVDYRNELVDKGTGQFAAMLRCFSSPSTSFRINKKGVMIPKKVRYPYITLELFKGEKLFPKIKEAILTFGEEKNIFWMKDITIDQLV